MRKMPNLAMANEGGITIVAKIGLHPQFGPTMARSNEPGAARAILQIIAPIVEELRIEAAKEAMTGEEDSTIVKPVFGAGS